VNDNLVSVYDILTVENSEVYCPLNTDRQIT